MLYTCAYLHTFLLAGPSPHRMLYMWPAVLVAVALVLAALHFVDQRVVRAIRTAGTRWSVPRGRGMGERERQDLLRIEVRAIASRPAVVQYSREKYGKVCLPHVDGHDNAFGIYSVSCH